MPSSYDGTTAIKTVCVSSTHPPQGNITLLSASGDLEAILNAEEITGFRTALVSMLLPSARHAAGLQVRKAVVFGTGKQAEWALRLLLEIFPGVGVTVVGRGTAREVQEKLPGGLSFEGFGRTDGDEEALRVLVEAADAVFCCTPAEAPLFPMHWITGAGKTVYVSLIGSYKPHMVEVEPALLKVEGVTVVVDSVDACLAEAGELIQGGLGREDVIELGSVLEKGEAVTGLCVFKCVGMGVMDLVAGRGTMRIAEQRGLGVKVEGF
jgi:ornithine cyclodeaminase/alanine dehydrogenase-like protein (mu-crystallin family)